MDGAYATGHGEVGADAVGFHALVQDALADVEAEVGAAMSGVEPDTAFMGLAGLGNQVAVAVQHAAGVGGEEVGDDVAGFHDGQQFTDDLGGVALFGVADVDHQADAGLPRGAFGLAWHLHAHDFQGR